MEGGDGNSLERGRGESRRNWERGGQELGCRREVEQEEFRKWQRRKIGEIGKGKTWRFVEGLCGRGGRWPVGGRAGEEDGGGGDGGAAVRRQRRWRRRLEDGGVSVRQRRGTMAGARSGGGRRGGSGGSMKACGGGGGGNWTPSPAFLEQPLERENTPFFFLK